MAVAEGYRITIEDQVGPLPDERYLYRLRLRDQQGRTAESAAVEEAP